MDKWKSRVAQWKDWAQEKGMAVEFQYWGEHEIWERLSRAEHRGRYFFWFHKELFSDQWFEDQVAEAIANAGPRYTPQLDVALPVAQQFDALGRTAAFCETLEKHGSEVTKAYQRCVSKRLQDMASDACSALEESVQRLLEDIQTAKQNTVQPIDWNRLSDSASSASAAVEGCIERLEKMASQAQKLPTNGMEPKKSEAYEWEQHYLRELALELHSFARWAQSDEAKLANVAALLLIGDAGTGKTHLFCDVAKRRIANGAPTILLFGGHFLPGEPWGQITRLLGLSCDRGELLDALSAAAESRRQRALILIDGLNAGPGK
jgi:chromosomal replication initiation ATPase DnaA